MPRLLSRVFAGAVAFKSLLINAGIAFGTSDSYRPSSWRISGWFFCGQDDVTASTYYILSLHNGVSTGTYDWLQLSVAFALGTATPPVLSCFMTSNGVARSGGLISGAPLKRGAWHHIMCQGDATGFDVYLNGALAFQTLADSRWNISGTNTTPGFALGSRATNGVTLSGTPVPGAFSKWRIVSGNRLTAAEAFALYRDSVEPGTTTAAWDFDDLTGSTVSLSAGTGSNGTITGGTWTTNVPMAPRDFYQNLHGNPGDLSTWFSTGLVPTGNTTPSPFKDSQGNPTLLYEIKEQVSGGAVPHRLFPPSWPTGLLPTGDSGIWMATAMVIKAGTRKNVGVATAATQTGGQFNTTVAPFAVSQVGTTGTGYVEDLGGGAYLCMWASTSPSGGLGGALFFNDDTGTGIYAVTAGNEKTAWVGNTCSAFSRVSAADAMRRARRAIMGGVVTTSKPMLYGPSMPPVAEPDPSKVTTFPAAPGAAVIPSSRRRLARVFPGAVETTTAGWIDFGTHAAYNIPSGAVSFWILPTGSTSNNARCLSLATAISGGTQIAELYSQANGISGAAVLGLWETLFDGQLTGNARPLVNGWQHVVVTWGPSGQRTYVNSTLVVSSSAASAVRSFVGNPHLYLGRYSGGTGNNMSGRYGDLRLYSSSDVLSAQQVRDLYFDDIDPSTPVARWAFDDLTGSTVSLTSGSGNNGTITNGTWTANVPMAPRDCWHNLLFNSGRPDLWSKTGLVATGATMASPLGAGFADLVEIKESNSSTLHFLVPTVFSVPALPYSALAVVVKYINRLRLAVDSVLPAAGTFFDVSTGIVQGLPVGAGTAASSEALGNGYYLLVVGGIAGAAPGLQFNDDSGNGTYAVTVGSEKSMWIGNAAFDYGRTVAEAMRSARAAALNNRSATKPSLYGDSIGTSPQNLAKNSEDLSTAFLGGGSVTVAATTVGGVATDKIVETVGGSVRHYAAPAMTHVSYGGTTAGAGSTNIWLLCHARVKAAERRYFAIMDTSLVGQSVTYDLTAGIITSSVVAPAFGMIDDGAGWYWCWAAIQAFNGAGFTLPQFGIFKDPGLYNNAANSYVGDGTSGLYLQKTLIQSIPRALITDPSKIGPFALGGYVKTNGVAVGLGARIPAV